jgi:hypothetical protein
VTNTNISFQNVFQNLIFKEDLKHFLFEYRNRIKEFPYIDVTKWGGSGMESLTFKDPERNCPFEGQDRMNWNACYWLNLNARIWESVVISKQQDQMKAKTSPTPGSGAP